MYLIKHILFRTPNRSHPGLKILLQNKHIERVSTVQ